MKTCWRLLKKINSHFPSNKNIVLKSTICLLFFKFSLTILSFVNFKKLFYSLTQTNILQDYNHNQISEITYAVKVISSHLPFETNCLVQALTTKFLLRHDKNVVLMIGVNIHTGFEAHAWVEKEGIIIIGDASLTHFTPLWDWK